MICFVRGFTFARGVSSMVRKVSLLLECIFLALVALCMRQVGSFVVSCMQIVTSAMSLFAAVRVALMRFVAASLEGRSLLLWLPTITTGTGRFFSMNVRADAV